MTRRLSPWLLSFLCALPASALAQATQTAASYCYSEAGAPTVYFSRAFETGLNLTARNIEGPVQQEWGGGRHRRLRGRAGAAARRADAAGRSSSVNGVYPHSWPTSGITCSANRSISSNWGLDWSSSNPTPASAKAPIRSATCSGVPTNPARSPRLDTE